MSARAKPEKQDLLDAVGNLNIYKSGERRAPHKPLLFLIALSKLRHGQAELSFEEATETLEPLLNLYAPPVESRHQPELPYWHLQSDGIWELPGADTLELQKGRFPKMHGLRQTSGRIPAKYAELLQGDSRLFAEVVQILLELHFDEALHDDILDEIGIPDVRPGAPDVDSQHEWARRLKRDPSFRPRVLRAYERRCAVSGFQIAIKDRLCGVDAAHMRWHSHGGPDTVDNGLALHPTLHLLLDKGAWSLTDDRRVIVSAELSGSQEGLDLVRSQHGRRLRGPVTGECLNPEFIRWHREPGEGGIFKGPALAL